MPAASSVALMRLKVPARLAGMPSTLSNLWIVAQPTPDRSESSVAETPNMLRAARICAPEIIDRCARYDIFYIVSCRVAMLSCGPEITVREVVAACAGAYSIRTTKGYGADLGTFFGWCRAKGCPWLPADPKVLAAFVDDQIQRHSIATIKRRLCAIGFAHRMQDIPALTDANVVRLAARRAIRQRPSRPKQVRGFTNAIRAKIVKACSATRAGLRDAALISVGYDTLCRSSELAAMRIEHVRLGSDGTGVVLIPRSKADIAGAGRVAYLSLETTRLLSQWIDDAALTVEPLFRSLHLHCVADGPLATSSIHRLIKRCGLDASRVCASDTARRHLGRKHQRA
jgi:integrase/recombinase XerD